MKKIDLKGMAVKSGGEYVFGAEDTGSHACYMIYGALVPGEKGRRIRPGKGHEEMITAVSGPLNVSGDCSGTLAAGEAMHLVGEQTCYLENTGSAEIIYIIAGGHAEHGHDH